MPDIIARSSAQRCIAAHLSDEERAQIDHEFGCYPDKKSVCIEALKIVQQHRGWVSDEAVEAVAAYLHMSAAEVEAVATFYNLIFRQPVGEQVIFLCDSVSCWIMGGEQVKEKIKQRLGIDYGQTTADGRYTLLPANCLGDCDNAPTLLMNKQQYRRLDDALLNELFGHPVESSCE